MSVRARALNWWQIETSDKVRTLNSEEERNAYDWILLHISRNVCHQREVLDQSAGLSFWGIARTQHTPLARLQRSGTTDLPRLLELGADTRHHTQCADERESTENVSDTGPLHLETLQRPVARTDRAHKASRDVVAHKLHGVERVELRCSRWLLQDFVDGGLEVCVEGFE